MFAEKVDSKLRYHHSGAIIQVWAHSQIDNRAMYDAIWQWHCKLNERVFIGIFFQ